ncbi:MAG: hypothetical protein PHR68_04660 [Candidatus Gracilibacteria bacterium]|nr:hypothetical protein [Candidatus Gracilibacteria bacterium]
MVKIDLSAMQKTNGENNDNSQKSSDINKKEEINSDKKNENQTISKKKISLNSLISSNGYLGENLKKSGELVENDIKENEILEKKEERVQILEKEEIKNDLTLSNIIDSNTDIKSENEEVIKKENLIIKEEKKDNSDELSEKLKIADGDTIGTLIVDIKKEEIFGNYVSSFEKEIQAIKKKKESKIIKEEEKLEKKEIIKGETTQNKEVEISHNDVNLDKILENIETKKIKKEKKISINFNFIKNLDKKYAKIFFAVILIFVFVIGLFYFKTIFLNKLNINHIPNNFGNNNFHEDIKKPDFNPENIKKIPEDNIYKTNNLEVKEKLIKYFKNKQINGNIN